jgi:hypothetical protein
MDLLQNLDAAGISFKLVVLLAIAGAYVLFELLLLAVEASKRPDRRGVGATTKLELEAYRPVTSWTSRPD